MHDIFAILHGSQWQPMAARGLSFIFFKILHINLTINISCYPVTIPSHWESAGLKASLPFRLILVADLMGFSYAVLGPNLKL